MQKMWRKCSIFLKKWSKEKKPKPLVLRGARQVGKSTLIKLFAEENGLDLIEINFENIKLQSLKQENFLFDQLIYEIEILTNKKIQSNTLLFFDEIQEMPEAIAKLRYFYEQKESYLVVSAGSLLELTLESANITMPVGRIEYLYIGPMTFFEFLVAINDQQLLSAWESIRTQRDIIHFQIIHEKFLQAFKNYLFVGGMPEAVNVYVQHLSNNNDAHEKVRRVHHSILNTYMDDIPKYTKRHKAAELAQSCFKYTLNHIADSNLKYSEVSKSNSHSTRDAFYLLHKAQIINLCFHTNATAIPLSALKNEKIMKLFFLDVGLFNTFRNLTYKELFMFSGDELVEKGQIVEQFVAQHLLATTNIHVRPELFFWTNVGGKNNYEVDFIFNQGSRIFPLEVKSGANTKSKSLNQCLFKTKLYHAILLDLKYREKFLIEKKLAATSSNNEMVELNIKQYAIPVYFTELLPELLIRD